MYPVAVAGPRLRLREFEPEDVTALHRVYGDVEATRFLSFEPRSRDAVELLVKRIVADAQTEPRNEYAMAVEAADGDMIGMARLATGEFRSGQVGFALRPDTWRQGYGAEAATLLLELGFGRLGLHRIWGARSPVNVASARVMASIGMIEEGRLRHHVFVRGSWRDSVVHSILEPEWAAWASRGRP